MTFEGACYPVWTNPDCNNAIDGADVLPILMYLIGQPLSEPCTQVGQYPSHCGSTAVGSDRKSVTVC